MERDQTNQGINKTMEICIHLFDMGRNGGECRDDDSGVFAHQRGCPAHVWLPVSSSLPFKTKTNINVFVSLAFALILRELPKTVCVFFLGTRLREIKMK